MEAPGSAPLRVHVGNIGILIDVGRAQHEHHRANRVLRLEGKKTVGSYALQNAVLLLQNEQL